MSKHYSITREQVAAMIEEVNESITAVTEATITETATAIQDSIWDDCIWADDALADDSSHSDKVTFKDLVDCVHEWLADRAEQAEEAELAVVLEGFPVRIRSEAQIADIHHTYKVATLMAETMQPTPEFGAEVIAQWTAMGTDDCLAMAAAYRAWLAGR